MTKNTNDIRLILTAEICGLEKSYLLAHPEFTPKKSEEKIIDRALKEYESGWPLAYVVGHKEFYGLDFYVDKHTLIPRPDTELMVETVIADIQKTDPAQKKTLVDIGTGTGCIPIAIKNNLEKITTFATDVDYGALRIAKKNSQRYHSDITFLHGPLFAPVKKLFFRLKDSLVFITANLPYLTDEQFAGEPSIQKEPRRALVADNLGGLSLYEKLFDQIKHSFSKQPYFCIYIEIDPRQKTFAEKLAKKYFPTAEIETKNDLADKARLVVIRQNFS